MAISDPVSLTARWIAAVRAVESRRPDRLFEDPFADALAGTEGHEYMKRMWQARPPPGSTTPESPFLVLRTRFIDDYIGDCLLQSEVKQIVIVAAGLDSRAFRLPLHKRIRFYELDRAEVLDFKSAKLQELDACPACQRIPVAVDLTLPFAGPLTASGFDPAEPALWIVEGLLCYLLDHQVRGLLTECARLAAPGSRLFADVMGAGYQELESAQPLIRALQELKAPFQFTSDEPETLLKDCGWAATAHRPSDLPLAKGRWPYPVGPRNAPGYLQQFFVTATRVI